MIDRLVAWISAKAMWLIAAAGALAVLEVVMRYVFDRPSAWTTQLVVAGCAIAFFLGGAEAARRDAHIRITLLYDRAHGPLRALMRGLTLLAGLVFMAGLFWGASRQFLESAFTFDGDAWRPETTGGGWNVPLPPVVRFFLVTGVVLLALQFVSGFLGRRDRS